MDIAEFDRMRRSELTIVYTLTATAPIETPSQHSCVFTVNTGNRQVVSPSPLVSELLTGELQALKEEVQGEKTLRAQAEKNTQEVSWKGGRIEVDFESMLGGLSVNSCTHRKDFGYQLKNKKIAFVPQVVICFILFVCLFASF